MSARTALLVLGMHRSGTSAVARLLNLLGADLGRELLPPKEDNAKGFWENQAFVRLHEAFLGALGRRWHDAAPLPAGWQDGAAGRRLRAGLREAIPQQFGAADLIAVKDPRLSLVLPLWLEVLRELDYAPICVSVVRDPREVAASLAARDGFAAEKSELLWLLHLLPAERAARGTPGLVLDYDAVLADWRGSMARIAQLLRRDWPVSPDRVAAEVARYLDPSHRHHRATEMVGEESSPVAARALALYRVLREPGDADRTTHMDAAAQWLDEQLRLAGPVIVDLERRLAALHARYESEIAEARRVLARKDEEIAAARQTIEGLVAEVDRARLAVNDQAGQIDAARLVIDAKQAELERAAAAIDDRDAQIAHARELLQLKDAEIAAAQANLGDGVVEAFRNLAALDAVTAANASKDAAIAAGHAAIASKDAAIAAADAAIASKDAELAAAREAMTAKEAEIDQARHNMGLLENEIEAARRHIDALGAEFEAARSAAAARDAAQAEAIARWRGKLDALQGSRWFALGRAIGLLRATDET